MINHVWRGGGPLAALQKGARIAGRDRARLATELKKAYAKGASIRELAQTHGRSYGFVHRVLTESGAPLRGRGGATRGAPRPIAPSANWPARRCR